MIIYIAVEASAVEREIFELEKEDGCGNNDLLSVWSRKDSRNFLITKR